MPVKTNIIPTYDITTETLATQAKYVMDNLNLKGSTFFYTPCTYNRIEQCCAAHIYCSQLSLIVNGIVESESGVTMLNNIVDNCEQCRQHNIQACSEKHCSCCVFFAVYVILFHAL